MSEHAYGNHPRTRHVILQASIIEGTGYVPFTLSTRRWGRKGPIGEVIVNSSVKFNLDEVHDWSPAEVILVVSSALRLPGDSAWFTPPLDQA